MEREDEACGKSEESRLATRPGLRATSRQRAGDPEDQEGVQRVQENVREVKKEHGRVIRWKRPQPREREFVVYKIGEKAQGPVVGP